MEKNRKKTKNLNLMEQMNKLSKRELALIYILMMVIILAGGVMLLIKPAVETHEEVSSQLAAAEQEKDEVDLLIAQRASLQVTITDLNTQISKLKDRFNAILVNEDIDALLTGMIVSSGLRPVALEIGKVSDSAQSVGEESTSEESSNVDSPSAEAIAGDGLTVKSTIVTVKAKGNISQFAALVGLAAEKKGVALRSFTLNGQDNDSSSSAVAAVLNEKSASKSYPYAAEMVFEVYQSSQV